MALLRRFVSILFIFSYYNHRWMRVFAVSQSACVQKQEGEWLAWDVQVAEAVAEAASAAEEAVALAGIRVAALVAEPVAAAAASEVRAVLAASGVRTVLPDRAAALVASADFIPHVLPVWVAGDLAHVLPVLLAVPASGVEAAAV